MKKNLIKQALDYYKGDKKMVMEALNISKTTLYDKIRRYEI